MWHRDDKLVILSEPWGISILTYHEYDQKYELRRSSTDFATLALDIDISSSAHGPVATSVPIMRVLAIILIHSNIHKYTSHYLPENRCPHRSPGNRHIMFNYCASSWLLIRSWALSHWEAEDNCLDLKTKSFNYTIRPDCTLPTCQKEKKKWVTGRKSGQSASFRLSFEWNSFFKQAITGCLNEHGKYHKATN